MEALLDMKDILILICLVSSAVVFTNAALLLMYLLYGFQWEKPYSFYIKKNDISIRRWFWSSIRIKMVQRFSINSSSTTQITLSPSTTGTTALYGNSTSLWGDVNTHQYMD